MAIDGGVVVVGASTATADTGAVYVFRTTDGGASYGQVAKLTADRAVRDHFGCSVAIAGDTVVVGTCNKDSGAVYVFRTSDGGASYVRWPS